MVPALSIVPEPVWTASRPVIWPVFPLVRVSETASMPLPVPETVPAGDRAEIVHSEVTADASDPVEAGPVMVP
jgi:hypothetical protein